MPENKPIASSANILANPVEYLKGVGPLKADLLKKELAIFTFGDLLHHFPYRHLDKTRITRIADLSPTSDFALVQGKLWYSETMGERSGKRLVAYLKDDSGVIELTWFKGLGWIDMHLLRSAQIVHLPFWTLDKRLSAVAHDHGLEPK